MHDKSYVKDLYPDINNEWKAFGKPSVIFMDNGKEYKNKEMLDACLTLGVEPHFAPKGTPTWKSSIERFFRTANTGFFHQNPGTTRSNPQQLGDNEDPKKGACISLNMFIMLLHKWIIDIYAQREHKGIHAVPSLLWDDMTNQYPVAWPNSIDEIAIALGRVEERRVKCTGIEIKGLYYNSSKLHSLFLKFNESNNGAKQDFKVKFDPLDIGNIYVYDKLFSKEWIKVPATYQQYAAGLSEWEHDEARKYARKKYCKVDERALCEAKAYIRNAIKNAMGYKISQIAKNSKINSTSETIDHPKVSSEVNCSIKLDVKQDISGSGYRISSNSVRLTPNVIPITSNRTEKKHTTRKQLNDDKDSLNRPLTEEDLAGFGIDDRR